MASPVTAPEDRYAMWSASLPVRELPGGGLVLREHTRPWNGRELTPDEVFGCAVAALFGGPQDAFEYLSKWCR